LLVYFCLHHWKCTVQKTKKTRSTNSAAALFWPTDWDDSQ